MDINIIYDIEEKIEEYNNKIQDKLVTCSSWPCYYFYLKDLKAMNTENTRYLVQHVEGSNKKAYTIKDKINGSIKLYSYNTEVLTCIQTHETNYIDIGYYSVTTYNHQVQVLRSIPLQLPRYIVTPEHPRGIHYYSFSFKKVMDMIYDQNRYNSYRLTPVTKEGVIASTEEKQLIYLDKIGRYYYIDMCTMEKVYKPANFKISSNLYINDKNKTVVYQEINKFKKILDYMYSKKRLEKVLNRLNGDITLYKLMKTFFKYKKIYSWHMEDIEYNIIKYYPEIKDVLKYATVY